jgi:hypothetical protein
MRRPDRDLPALSVLGLLLHGARYTFEMYRRVVERRMCFLTGLPRALYHAGPLPTASASERFRLLPRLAGGLAARRRPAVRRVVA